MVPRSTTDKAEFVFEIPKQFHPRISKDFLVKVFCSNDFFEIYMAYFNIISIKAGTRNFRENTQHNFLLEAIFFEQWGPFKR